MISSYFKTAKRVITRNRAFSIINIVGLAASMSVGLLFITILADVLRYDQFHENKDRIVRVITNYRDSKDKVDLATSSPAIGQEIREHVPEAEVVTTVGYGFDGDVTRDGETYSLKAHWAQPSFFEVFSFPLLKGDPATALTKPNSMVITESAALKIFNTTDVLGKSLARNDEEFVITGLMTDVTKFSHMKFEALASNSNPDDTDWGNVFGNFTYVLMREGAKAQQIKDAVNRIAEKRKDPEMNISFDVQALSDIVFFSESLDNQIGTTMPMRFLWLISGLSIIVLVTACFNYTNLSIARASRRMREVGIRKVIGARRRQVVIQFVAESTVISVMALLFALVIFSMIKSQFLLLTPTLEMLFDLTLTPAHVVFFVVSRWL